MDTLRADHLSCYGYSRQTSPYIDQLADGGVLFQKAYSPIPLTGPSHSSLLTSVYPQQHGATINGMRIGGKPRPITLAQILHRNGYRTAAFVSAWPLKKGILGLGRGFDVYNDKFTYHYKLVNSARRASEVSTAALGWLRKPRKRPFFLWVHFFDPHSPYELHQQYSDLPIMKEATGAPAGSAIDREALDRIRAYDSEIAFTDQHIGRLLEEVNHLKLREKTLVILTADHGENLGENGYVGHGDRLDQPIVHVPLIFSYPGVIPSGKTTDHDASLVDIMPTLLAYAGIEVRVPMEGRNLKPLIESDSLSPSGKPAYFLTYSEPPLLPPKWISWVWNWAKTKMDPSQVGFAHGSLKFVLKGDERRPYVYQLDPSVANEFPLQQSPSQIATYSTQVNQWLERTNRGIKPEGNLSPEDVEMLRSLGYFN